MWESGLCWQEACDIGLHPNFTLLFWYIPVSLFTYWTYFFYLLPFSFYIFHFFYLLFSWWKFTRSKAASWICTVTLSCLHGQQRKKTLTFLNMLCTLVRDAHTLTHTHQYVHSHRPKSPYVSTIMDKPNKCTHTWVFTLMCVATQH